MRKNSRRFVRNVIIISVISMIALMILLFMAVQSLMKEKEVITYLEPTTQNTIDTKVELSETLLIVVHHISAKSVEGYDIKSEALVSQRFTETTRISDAYGNIIPVTEIKPGDILEVECGKESKQVLSASRSKEVESWKKISGITINQERKEVSVGGTNYGYNEHTMIIDSNGEEQAIDNIGPYDIVTVTVYDHMVRSIIINESSASIKVENLPTSTGTIEIDYSRLIDFRDITQPIKVIPGKHKLVIKMQGYKTITKEFELASGEVYELSLEGAEKAYTLVDVNLYNEVSDYEIIIGDKTYKPGEEIKLVQGTYKVRLLAEGYEEWERNVLLSEERYTMHISLKPIEEEEEETLEEETTEIEESQTVSLNTDPEGANVYIDGILKGQTPYTCKLLKGSHAILFDKDGYEMYAVNIEVDNETENSYLYRLSEN